MLESARRLGLTPGQPQRYADGATQVSTRKTDWLTAFGRQVGKSLGPLWLKGSQPIASLCDRSTRLPAGETMSERVTFTGRNDSPASGSFREANLQRRLSGGEFEELSVATRPLCIALNYV